MTADDPIRVKLDAVIDALGSYDTYKPAPSDTVMDMVMAIRDVLDLCEVPAMRFEQGEFVYVSEIRAAIATALGLHA